MPSLIATPMQVHTDQAVAALHAGKHVISEVTACVTHEEALRLIEAVEATGLTYMMAENYTYMRPHMMVRHMAEQGVFGELTYAEGMYVHDCRHLKFNDDGSLTWRGQLTHDMAACNYYPTHSLGPIAQWMGIGRDDKIATVYCAATPGLCMADYADRRFGSDHPGAEPGYWPRGDGAQCLVTTERGRLISLRVDSSSHRPHHMTMHELQGTRGCYRTQSRATDEPLIWLDGRSPAKDGDPFTASAWETLYQYAHEFEHPRWKAHGEQAKKAGHGGGDFFGASKISLTPSMAAPPTRSTSTTRSLGAVSSGSAPNQCAPVARCRNRLSGQSSATTGVDTRGGVQLMTQMPDTDAVQRVDRERAAATHAPLRRRFTWQRDDRNPILPPQPGSAFDSHCCMNAWALRDADGSGSWRMFYAGSDSDDRRRLCVATCAADDAWNWQRHGPVLSLGAAGAFDDRWCVLPHVVRMRETRWHLYYTGRSHAGQSLASFRGIGLAVSDDGMHWQRHDENPVLRATGQAGDDDAFGMAGGSVVRIAQPDGRVQWRFYYTGCPSLGEDVFLDQQKRICLATSDDGVHWHKHGAVMRRDPERDYENVAVAGAVVRQLSDGTFCMWYSAIGTRWGYYSICYAESDDGIHWRRGEPRRRQPPTHPPRRRLGKADGRIPQYHPRR